MTNRFCILILVASLFASCTGKKEKEITEQYIQRKVEETFQEKVAAFHARCREDYLKDASVMADSILRRLIFSNLDTLNRPVRAIKPYRPGFEPSNEELEKKPTVDNELISWLKEYETFLVGDITFLQAYFDSLLLLNLDSSYFDSLNLENSFHDSLYQKLLQPEE